MADHVSKAEAAAQEAAAFREGLQRGAEIADELWRESMRGKIASKQQTAVEKNINDLIREAAGK